MSLKWSKFFLFFFCASMLNAELLITSTVPARGQEDVALDTEIHVDFNKELEAYTVSDFTVSLSDSAADVPGKVTYFPDLKRIIFTPAGGLQKGEQYILKIYPGIMAADGDRLKLEYVVSFDTGNRKDLIIPQIVSSVPEQASVDIDENTEIRVVFSEPLSQNSIRDSMSLSGGRKAVKLAVDYFPDQCLLLVKPQSALEFETEYRLKISRDITDMQGNHLAEDFILEFSTRKEPDRIPPELLASLPLNGQFDIPVTTEVILKVSEPLGDICLVPENFLLESADDTVSCRIIYNPVISEIKAVLEKPLKEETDYQLTIKNLCDTSGNQMKARAIRFRTAKLPDDTCPELLEVLPADGALDIPLNAQITFRFTEPVSLSSFKDAVVLTEASEIVKGELRADETLKVISFQPFTELKPNFHYRVTLKKDVTDLSGNHLQKGLNTGFVTIKIREEEAKDLVNNPPVTEEKKLESMIADITGVPLIAPLEEILEKELPADTEPVRIIDCFPHDGFRGVALDSRISLIFNKELDEKSLIPQNISLMQEKDNFAVSIIYDYEYRKLTLTPKSVFYPRKKVELVLKAGIRDKTGNHLSEYRISFTTGDSLDSEIEIMLEQKKPVSAVETPFKPAPQLLPEIEDVDFYSEGMRQNFTREEWARYLVQRLHKTFVPFYNIAPMDDFLKTSRYELAMIIQKILIMFHKSDNAYLFQSKKGIAKMLLLEQAVIEFEKELTLMGAEIRKFEDVLKKKGIPVDRMREDMDNGIIKGKI